MLDIIPHSQQEKINPTSPPPLPADVKKLKTKVPVHPENSYLNVEFKNLLCAVDNVCALDWACFMIRSTQNKLTYTGDLLSFSVLSPNLTKPKELH